MPDSPADTLPSLSSTCPTTDTTEPTSSSSHDTPPLQTNTSDLHPRPPRRGPATSSKANDEAVRTAKQHIRSRLREDWTWPPPPPPLTSPPPPSSSSPPQLEVLESGDTVIEWRERDSDSSLASTPQQEINSPLDPYRYDSPDSLHQPVLSRKRKRRRRLREEMEWNDGLKIYVERRNAWAGARTRPRTPPPQPSLSFESPFDSSPYLQHCPPPPPPAAANVTSSSTPLASSSSRTVVPVAPPILPPDHVIRATVQPGTYPQIYSKIIIQGLAPTVPINLKDVVSSLVVGWKKDGEWPPKSEAEKAGLAHGAGGEGMGMGMGAHPRKAVRRSVGRVKRALGFGHDVDGGGEVEEGKPF